MPPDRIYMLAAEVAVYNPVQVITGVMGLIYDLRCDYLRITFVLI
jgi:hypothetical protein